MSVSSDGETRVKPAAVLVVAETESQSEFRAYLPQYVTPGKAMSETREQSNQYSHGRNGSLMLFFLKLITLSITPLTRGERALDLAASKNLRKVTLSLCSARSRERG